MYVAIVSVVTKEKEDALPTDKVNPERFEHYACNHDLCCVSCHQGFELGDLLFAHHQN